MVKILENVIIYFKNGTRECHSAISFRKKGICTGHISNEIYDDSKFIEQGYIPLNQIKKITYSKDNNELNVIEINENEWEE